MNTYIVLIPVEDNHDARKICEDIENTNFEIETQPCSTVNAYKVLLELNKLLGLNEDSNIEVEPISDFMDRANDEGFNVDSYFISYVTTK